RKFRLPRGPARTHNEFAIPTDPNRFYTAQSPILTFESRCLVDQASFLDSFHSETAASVDLPLA
ncbi:MAG: hypothetical protein VX211_04130, partial [Pseudomonadota bacterium]|nr:hypothetical protein [Pseudomonadota bacterium]